ncbi:hypothetical protein EEY24_08800 [Shewanella algae]|nr:hypothetical protein EEY24_08800 [Shewanella algae]
MGKIKNRIYRQCARDGFNARIRAELADERTGTALNTAQNVPLYSHHATRQSMFERGWQAVTPMHIKQARAKAQAMPNP